MSDKLMKARCRLISTKPFYGTFAMRFIWKPDDFEWAKGNKTIGVRFTSDGMVECIYYPPFVEERSLEEMCSIIMHEIEHIVRLHPARIGNRHPMMWNIGCDMCCNGTKHNCRIDFNGSHPADAIFIPDDWEDNLTAEEYYEKLVQNAKSPKEICAKCKKKCPYDPNMPPNVGGNQQGGGDNDDEDDQDQGQDDDNKQCGSGEGSGDQEGPGEDQGGDDGNGVPDDCPLRNAIPVPGDGTGMDNHEIWNKSELSKDEARQLVRDMARQAIEKVQGNVPGHLEEALKQLNKPVVTWRQILRQVMGRTLGNRRQTYSRRNRRIDQFGVKGISHHNCGEVSVIVDTSGSMSKEELGQAFSEIEQISHKTKIGVLQWDIEFQRYDKYRRGDWKKIQLRGRGGTGHFGEAVQWLIDNRCLGQLCVFITDGEMGDDDYPQQEIVPMVFVITTSQPGPRWAQNSAHSQIIHIKSQ